MRTLVLALVAVLLSPALSAGEGSSACGPEIEAILVSWEEDRGTLLSDRVRSGVCQEFENAASWFGEQENPPSSGAVLEAASSSIPKHLDVLGTRAPLKSIQAHLAEELDWPKGFVYPTSNGFGRLRVSATPNDALVSLGEGSLRPMGLFLVEAGTLRVVIQRAGYQSCERTVEVPEGGTVSSNCELISESAN